MTADDAWTIEANPDVQQVERPFALALDIAPRDRKVIFGTCILGTGSSEVGNLVIYRGIFEVERADWRSATEWLGGDEAGVLLARVAAGYRAEMAWSCDWIGEWTEDAWKAAEALHARVTELVGG